MTIKVKIKGQKEKEAYPQKEIQTKTPPAQKRRDSIILRMIKIMLMDIRMKFKPSPKKDYDDYCAFAQLARGKP